MLKVLAPKPVQKFQVAYNNYKGFLHQKIKTQQKNQGLVSPKKKKLEENSSMSKKKETSWKFQDIDLKYP